VNPKEKKQVCLYENSVLAESSYRKVEKYCEVDPVGSPTGAHFFIFQFFWAVRSRALRTEFVFI
jgi:hypothetical protein